MRMSNILHIQSQRSPPLLQTIWLSFADYYQMFQIIEQLVLAGYSIVTNN